MFDNIKEDVKRAYPVNSGGLISELFYPGTMAVLVYRFGHWAITRKSLLLRFLLKIIYWPVQWFIRGFTGINIPTGAEIGPGLVIHTWGGVFIPRCKIGRNAMFQHGVVVNWNCKGIGDNAYFGPGCKVIKPVRIGNHACIGANAVVLEDVPDNCTVAGIPARIVRHHEPPESA